MAAFPITELIQRLDQLQSESGYRDDVNGLYCCRLALDALEQGNYGVAAILIDSQGEVVAQAENRVFNSGYNSSAHAEMLLVDQLEQGLDYSPAQLTMLVSLEPCPMCLARLILSGIASVRYMVPDSYGGMVSHAEHFPPAWKNLAQLQNHYEAHISSAVRVLAADIAATNLSLLRKKLLSHIRP